MRITTMSSIDIKAVAQSIQAYRQLGVENHPDPDLSENLRKGLPSPRQYLVEAIQRDYPDITFEQYDKAARLVLAQATDSIDINNVVTSLKVHFERGLEGEQLAERIRSDFPGISSADYVKAAESAWAQILASGELQIKRIDDLKYSVWFVSGGYVVREWEGDEHWEAAFQAMIAHGKYNGVKVFDQVTGETLLARRVVGMEAA
jgi:hypothetical protein